MENAPEIFDRRLLRRRKTRAWPQMGNVAYLLDHVACDLAERLLLIHRDFPLALDLGAHGAGFAQKLSATGKIGCVLRAPICEPLTGPADGAVLVCEPEALPVAPASLDLVVSAFGLELVNDLPGTLLQIRRALKPDGMLLAAMLGGRSLEQLRHAFAQAEIAISGGISPRVAPFADVRDLGQLLQRAGFALPVADSETLTVTYSHPLTLMTELKAMGVSNMLTDRRKQPLRRDVLAAAVQYYADASATADGRIAATFEIVTLTGWAPHASQQQPLRPGSAKSSLADAISAS